MFHDEAVEIFEHYLKREKEKKRGDDNVH